MAEATLQTQRASGDGDDGGGSSGPAAIRNPVANAWRRISPSLVPVLAVITALVLSIPLMIFTRGEGDVGKGLQVARSAYTALLEGSIGLAANPIAGTDDVDLMLQYATYIQTQASANPDLQPLQQRDLLRLSRDVDAIASVGRGNIVNYSDVLARYADVTITDANGERVAILPDEASINTLGEYVTVINEFGEARLRELAPVILDLGEFNPAEVRRLAESFGGFTELTEEDRQRIREFAPAAADYSDEDLLYLMEQLRSLRSVVGNTITEGVTRLNTAYVQLGLLEQLELSPNDADARAFGDIYRLGTERTAGVQRLRELIAVEAQLATANIQDIDGLAGQLRWTNNLYRAGALQNTDVAEALIGEYAYLLEDSLVVRRPNNNALVYSAGAGQPLPGLMALNSPVLPSSLYVLHHDTPGADIIERQRILNREVVAEQFQAAYLPLAFPFRNLFSDTLLPADTAVDAYRLTNRELTSESTTRVNADTVYLRLGGYAFMFFPSSLEATLTRSIPYVIAGLAVALGFKAGLFNIGAEGQLYTGSLMAVWVAINPPDTVAPVVITVAGILLSFLLINAIWQRPRLPQLAKFALAAAVIGLCALLVVLGQQQASLWLGRNAIFGPFTHLVLVLAAGLLGGALWGFIPGVLKAYTGAHEVITTIMLNFVAIRLADWLIKSTQPVFLLDTESSTPRTPFLFNSARLPTFDNIFIGLVVAAGIVTVIIAVFLGVRQLQKQGIRAFVRQITLGLIAAIGAYFLVWTSVRGTLHLGFVLMLAAVWLVGWFLDRTTSGFELRTVGANPDAARYAGMNVKWNIMLAMTLSGALAGLAGTIQISGVQHNMQPEFFAGLGFDSIAVALLARNNPRSMIPAGILWGALLTGAGLMQVNANISINLVQIIQALIIMFIAADAIIRRLWLIPDATAEEKAAAQFSKGWGG